MGLSVFILLDMAPSIDTAAGKVILKKVITVKLPQLRRMQSDNIMLIAVVAFAFRI